MTLCTNISYIFGQVCFTETKPKTRSQTHVIVNVFSKDVKNSGHISGRSSARMQSQSLSLAQSHKELQNINCTRVFLILRKGSGPLKPHINPPMAMGFFRGLQGTLLPQLGSPQTRAVLGEWGRCELLASNTQQLRDGNICSVNGIWAGYLGCHYIHFFI